MPSSKLEPVGTLIIAFRGQQQTVRISGVLEVDYLALLNALNAYRVLGTAREEMRSQPEESRREQIRQAIGLPKPPPPRSLPKKFTLHTYYPGQWSGPGPVLVRGGERILPVTKIDSIKLQEIRIARIILS